MTKEASRCSEMLPWATFSYCPLDIAECRTLWKRFSTADKRLWSPTFLPFCANKSFDSRSRVQEELFWFSILAYAANLLRFGLGSWNISCQTENKLRCESFWPMSTVWTCSSQTLPCRLWINYKEIVDEIVMLVLGTIKVLVWTSACSSGWGLERG